VRQKIWSYLVKKMGNDMPYIVGDCSGTKRNGTVLYYFFPVSKGQNSQSIPVGITDQAIHPTGEPPRTAEVLMPAARAWLEKNLSRGFDPATQTSPLILDAKLLDYWVAYGQFPT
jgi:hypothetical protein